MMRYLSTFTGGGVLDVGLEELGATCVGYSEIKESSCRIYDRAYPGRRNFGDITEIAPGDLPDFDLMTGGFPCQAFSLAGKREGFKDRRGQMIFYLYDILVAKKPFYCVLENVKGIVSHDKGRTFRNVVNLLAHAGYFVRVIQLNASHYGSAQNRERVFFLCSREDFPKKRPEKGDDSKRFRDFREAVPSDPVWIDEGNDRVFADTVRKAAVGAGTGHIHVLGPTYEVVGGYDRVGTLLTGIAGGGPQRALAKVTRQNGVFRFLTEIEGERLQGLPDGFTAGESRKDRWFLIGNAVHADVSRYLFQTYLKGVWW